MNEEPLIEEIIKMVYINNYLDEQAINNQIDRLSKKLFKSIVEIVIVEYTSHTKNDPENKTKMLLKFAWIGVVDEIPITRIQNMIKSKLKENLQIKEEMKRFTTVTLRSSINLFQSSRDEQLKEFSMKLLNEELQTINKTNFKIQMIESIIGVGSLWSNNIYFGK